MTDNKKLSVKKHDGLTVNWGLSWIIGSLIVIYKFFGEILHQQ